ncbi:MAG: hypothetical protein DRO88_06130 [Promethearchaeia archaeon]|nr:MAG: hypothetical protein DRO88_06130 [Candidatus Lokiarchaeia archaeon]
MEILFLGTSGHGITLERNLPSILIDRCILFDCGEGTLKSLKQNHISVTEIKYIFISHLHADHWMGLLALLWESALYSRENLKIPQCSPEIFVPEGMKDHVLTLIRLTYSPFARVKFQVKVTELPQNANHPLIIQGRTSHFQIEWLTTEHLPLCYAFRINNVLGISGDTRPSENLIPFFSKLLTLIHEATFSDDDSELAHKLKHSTPSDCARLGHKAGVLCIILTHVPPLTGEKEKIFLKDAKKIFSNIIVARDSEKFKISSDFVERTPN